MVVLGIDAHKRTHTVVAVDEHGRQIATKTFGTTTADHLALLRWAQRLEDRHGDQRRWAVEDCRHLSRRLERDLLGVGEQVVRVAPKLMAHVRDSARTYGKSDPIDALAVARAALREPELPTARLDGPDRDLRLLVDHREDLVGERTGSSPGCAGTSRELDPSWEPKARAMDRPSTWSQVSARLEGVPGVVARLARDLVARCAELTETIRGLESEIAVLARELAPALLLICGCGPLTAAKLLGETAGVDRFRSRDAFARHNGTAPLPVWSSNRARHRLSRTGNRQLNAAIHRIALTQARCHPDAQAFIARRVENGDSKREALRALKRRLSDVVYRALRADLAVDDLTLAA